MSRKWIFIPLLILGLTAGVYLFLSPGEKTPLSNTTKQTNGQDAQQGQPKQTGFNKNLYKLDEPGSPWWVVNKIRPLNPINYVPEDLEVAKVRLRLSESAEQSKTRAVIQTDLIQLFNAASQAGYELVYGSGFRSYAYQKNLYDGYVRDIGQAETDKVSARPGTSEHQTGLSFDVTLPNQKCFLEKCFGELPEGKWVAENAYKYGFIIRYPEGKTAVTGYDYEPWHLRYVGKELALEMHNTGIQTLEEFFGLPPAPDYIN